MSIENAYVRTLRGWAEFMLTAVQDIVIPQLPALVAEFNVDQPKINTDSIQSRLDNAEERLAQLMQAVTIRLDRELSTGELFRAMEDAGISTDQFNEQEMARLFRAVLGIDLIGEGIITEQVLGGFVRENVALISSLREEFVRDTERIVLNGFRQGLRHEVIAQQIQGIDKDPFGFATRAEKTRNRAELIARDQINKLNGQLTKMRQINAGLEEYRWRNVGDDRVRPSHVKAQEDSALVPFRWDDPPIVDGQPAHPGQPIRCRCWAKPVFDDLVQEVEAENFS